MSAAGDVAASALAYADDTATVTEKHREHARKALDALALAGYGVLTPAEVMLNASNAVELRKLRDQQFAIREFLGLTYRVSPNAYDEPPPYTQADYSADLYYGIEG